MKIVIPGGRGQVGQLLARHLGADGHEIIALTRHPRPGTTDIGWDGKSLGDWRRSFEGADVIINLAGRSVNCRYDEANLKAIMDSRVDSTWVVGEAIANCQNPPVLWLQASTATIYAHRFDAANDEATGILGGDEPGAPPKWNASIKVAKSWEKALWGAKTPHTRKVALRSAMTMSVDKGGIFDVMATLARRGLGGTAGNGRQYVSWIHEEDFVNAVRFLIEREDLDGPVNLCSPNPLPNEEFFRILRHAFGAKIGLPASALMLEIGAIFMKTETELLLKSRRVVPGRLLDAEFRFRHPDWREAVRELVQRWH
ncbi:TIGR01777 family protein [bacterium]|nr:MAG: TIGR01777 family protein [bacterium]